jgi:hypothetical protein
MGMKKIVVNAKVRALLFELDEIMDRLHAVASTLARRDISASEAMNAGADREAIRAQIVGVAYRLNEASIRRAAIKRHAKKKGGEALRESNKTSWNL